MTNTISQPLGTFLSSTESAVRGEVIVSTGLNFPTTLLQDSLSKSAEKTSKEISKEALSLSKTVTQKLFAISPGK